MSVVRAEHEFAQKLGTLEGQEFQDEVCRFLHRCMTDFQPIPPKPQGDGGLDGLSHGQSVAYLCYGPEQEPSKVKARGLAKDIIEKFRDDLRRIFELKPRGKGKKTVLDHAPNDEMKTILASGRKISVIRLVVSVFDTHRIIGPLNEAFDASRQASRCAYVDDAASMTIWGPRHLATMGAVDDATILRLEQRALLKRVSVVLASSPAPPASLSTTDFDAKFDWVEANGKPRPGGVATLRKHFMQRWLEALAIENDFANNSLALHQALSVAREDAAVDAELESSNQSNAPVLIQAMRAKLAERLEQAFGTKLPPELLKRLTDGEVARLIGECPIEWRS